ncbi:MAG: class I SAM-dependent methyltransferase [Candidatus Eisenbacteria bacterium]
MTVQTMQEHERVTLHHGIRDFRRRGLNALVRRYVRGKHVLDLRCLSGHLSVSLAEAGHAVTALDAYAGAVAMTNDLAEQRGMGRLAELWGLEGLADRFPSARFDTVLCVDVLNHVRDDRATLDEIARVIRPGGRLILAVPALHRLLGARDRRLGHLRRYSNAELKEALRSADFAVESMRHWNTLALPMQFLWEHVLRRELGDGLRYGPENPAGRVGNRLLGWWYLTAENYLPAPIGLTLFAIARKNSDRDG